MLLTEQQLSRRRGIHFPQPERLKKVRKGMGAIRQVLGERKRDKLSRLALEAQVQAEESMNDETLSKEAAETKS